MPGARVNGGETRVGEIDLQDGEHIFIKFRGSVEHSILVQVTSEGQFVVVGPMNISKRTIEITLQGIRECQDDCPEATPRPKGRIAARKRRR